MNLKFVKVAVTIVAAILLMLLYLMIFNFSDQDGEESGSLSRKISEKCVDVVDYCSGKDMSEKEQDALADKLEHPIRKLAHFGEYMCMGILLFIIFAMYIRNKKLIFIINFFWVFISAALDEFHQTFVPGRYGCFTDVCIDTSGGIIGTFLCIVILWIINYKRKKEAE